MAEGSWVPGWLGGADPATPTKQWEMSGLSTPRPSVRASPRGSPHASPQPPSSSHRSHEHSAQSSGHLRPPNLAASGSAGAPRAASPFLPKSTPGRRRPPRPLLTSFSQNLVSVLNDPTRPRDPELFTRDWGDGFIPPPPQSAGHSRQQHRPVERQPLSARKSIGKARKSARRQPSATEIVPEVFFRQDFDIGKPETFEEVLDPTSISMETAGAKHEEFGDYLDVVETELSRSLSSRSDKFFGALTEQQVLHQQVIMALDDIQDLRGHLANAQREAADDDLLFLKLLSSRDNAYALYQKLGMLHTVSQTPSTIQLLLHTGDFVEALDLIATTQEIVRTELSGLHCLKHFVSQLRGMEEVVHTMMRQEFVNSLLDELGAIPSGANGAGVVPLRELAGRHTAIDPEGDEKCDRMRALLAGITRQEKFDFTPPYRKAVLGILQDVIKQQLARKIDGGDGSHGSAATRFRQVSFEKWIGFLELLLRSLLLLLLQVDATHSRITHVLRVLRGEDESVIDVVAPVSESPLFPDAASGVGRGRPASAPSTSAGSNDLGSSLVTPDPIESLEHEGDAGAVNSANALAILDGTSDGVTGYPERSPGAGSAVQERGVSTDAGGSVAPSRGAEPGWSAKDYRGVMRESERVVLDVCEEMHSKVSKMVLSRKQDKVDANISVEMFVREFDLLGEFIDASESVRRKPCVTLRGTSHSLARDFVSTFHLKQKEKLAHLLANERWSRANVPSECQDVVDWLVKPRDGAAAASGGGGGNAAKTADVGGEEAAAVAQAPPPAPAAAPLSKVLRIGDSDFRTVGALLMYLRIIKDYVYCAEAIVPLAQEIMTKLLENLRLFNQRTRNLVLQVGALNLGLGLKTISAKNLGLASQSLGAIIALLGTLHARFVALLPPKLTVFAAEFDRVMADYKAHRADITKKFVNIMESQWDECAKEMNWAKMETTVGAQKVTVAAVTIHKILKPVLPAAEIIELFRSILTAYNKRLRTAAKNRGPNGKAVAVGIVADVVHYEDKLSGLSVGLPIEVLREGLDALGLVLPALVREVAK